MSQWDALKFARLLFGKSARVILRGEFGDERCSIVYQSAPLLNGRCYEVIASARTWQGCFAKIGFAAARHVLHANGVITTTLPDKSRKQAQAATD